MLAAMMQYLPGVATRLVDFSMYARLFAAVTGIRMSTREFLTAGERIHVLERYMNTREGISRKDDTLPERFLSDVRRDDPRQLTVPLDKMLDRYYQLRGYNTNGIPTTDTLDNLGIVAR
jgi:aldehyde:ferredoxin oxidoreductase